MEPILEQENMVTAIYNTYKNRKEKCDYNCGQKFMNDKFLQPKLNVCKANCDVIWESNYVRELQAFISGNMSSMNSEYTTDLRKRLDVAKKRLVNSKARLIKTKFALRKILYGRRADMSMMPVQNGPAYEG